MMNLLGGLVDWLHRPDVARLEARKEVLRLIQALSYGGWGDWNVRRDAAQALGRLRDTRAVEPLTRILESGDSMVHAAAVWAIESIGEPSAVEPLIAFARRPGIGAEAGRAAAEAVLRITRDPLRFLNDESIELRERATESIACAPRSSPLLEQAIEPLIRALEERGPGQYTVHALARTGDERAVAALIRLLEGRYKVDDALDALAEVGDERAIVPILALVARLAESWRNDSVDRNLTSAEKSLESIRSRVQTKALEPLLEVLQSEEYNQYAHGMAAIQVGKLGDQAAVRPLADLLNVRWYWLQESGAVAWALGRLGWEPADDAERIRYQIARRDFELEDSALQSAVATGVMAETLEHLGEYRGRMGQCESDPGLVHALIAGLGKAGGERACQALCGMFSADRRHCGPGVDMARDFGPAAARALVGIGKPAVDSLVDALRHVLTHHGNVDCVVYALGEIGDPRAEESLREALVAWTSADRLGYPRRYYGQEIIESNVLAIKEALAKVSTGAE